MCSKIIGIVFLATLFSCKNPMSKIDINTTISSDSIAHLNESIIAYNDQETIFEQLSLLLKGKISPSINDSAFFLIIPIDASCNTCRDKATAAAMKYKDFLRQNQFIIFSSKGIKLIKAYFENQKFSLPQEGDHFFYDSDNLAFINDLIFTHPTTFKCYNEKAYEKVISVPLSIDKDLENFFKQ